MMLSKIKGNWLLYWVVIIAVTYEVVKHTFDPVITLGDIIVLATTVPALVFGAWKTVAYFLYRKYPFKLEFQEQLSWQGKKRPTMKSLSLPLGESKVIVRVRPRHPTTFKRVHLRFLDKPNVDANFPPKAIVCFGNELEVTGEGYFYSLDGVMPDKTNGIQGNLAEEWDCASEESMFVEVRISAKAYWKGYLMFQSHREDKHRGYGYLPLEVGIE